MGDGFVYTSCIASVRKDPGPACLRRASSALILSGRLAPAQASCNVSQDKTIESKSFSLYGTRHFLSPGQSYIVLTNPARGSRTEAGCVISRELAGLFEEDETYNKENKTGTEFDGWTLFLIWRPSA